jgi:hypothetical protein
MGTFNFIIQIPDLPSSDSNPMLLGVKARHDSPHETSMVWMAWRWILLIYQYEADMNRDRCGLFHPLGGLHSTTKSQLHGGEACKGQKSRDGGLRL